MLPLVIVSALTAATALAQEAKPTAGIQSTSAYERLFTVPAITVTGAKHAPQQELGKSSHIGRHVEVVPKLQHMTERGPCNMPIIVGDASGDPGMVIPHGKHGKPAIRVVPPRACGEK